jgi:hypothetical protein
MKFRLSSPSPAIGNLVRKEAENGGILEYDYHAMNWLRERRSAGATAEVSSTRRVPDALDAAGNRVDRLIQDGAGVQQQRLVYTVNARNQVTGIETRNGANAATGTEVLVCDANGNWIGRSVGGVTQTHRYDRRNRELARGGMWFGHNDAKLRTAQVDGSLRTEWVMDVHADASLSNELCNCG